MEPNKDLCEGKNWTWKTEQTPQILLTNIQLVLKSWESLTLADIEISGDGIAGISRPKYQVSNTKGVEPQSLLYKNTCPRSQGKERKVCSILSSKGHRPNVYAVGEEYHLEEWIENTGMLPSDLVKNDTMLQHCAKSIAVLHHDEEIKAYLRTKNYETNKIMSDGTEDWIKTFEEQGIQAKFCAQAESPEFKELSEAIALKRSEGLDETIRKYYVDVKSSVLGEVAAHRDCHKSNWIMPKDAPEKPILVDYEEARIEFAGIDLGVQFISGGWKQIYNKEQRRNFLKHYLQVYFDEFKQDKTDSFEVFYESIIDKFELECLAGGMIYNYWCLFFLMDLAKDSKDNINNPKCFEFYMTKFCFNATLAYLGEIEKLQQ